jgi:hypothetical protein
MNNKTHAEKEIVKGEKDPKHIHDNLIESDQLLPELRTLAYCSNKAVEDGYTENFKATPEGLESMETNKKYQPEEVKVVNFYRFEGVTDPADMSVLYVIEANDGAKGTLVDAYGAYSDFDVAKVIRRIDSIAKVNPSTGQK